MPSSIFCIAVIPSLPLTKQQVPEEVQELVHRSHERRDDQHGEDHDDRRVDQLLARRPADLGELDLNFLDELPCLPCPGHSAPHRCSFARPRPPFGVARRLARQWQAWRDLNPRLPVLETGALARLSYRPAPSFAGAPGRAGVASASPCATYA